MYFADTFWPVEYRHGKYALADALTLKAPAAARLGPGLCPEDFRDAAFLDIEPTGLSARTSRFAFLVGLGSFEAFSFRLRQFFLADLADEPSMLEALAQEIGRKRLIVTFNGRAFDLPRLETRFALCGLASPFANRTHVDLLDAARRLNTRGRESCGLRALESRFLHVDRADVIAQRPDLYFRGHRTDRPASWDPLFFHNALDVLSLVSLVAHVGRVISRTPPAASLLLALARWDDETGSPASAAKLYAKAWRLDPGGDVGGEAIARLARLSRSYGKKAAVAHLWQREVATAAFFP